MARPKGSPKVGGRQKGTLNHATKSVKELAQVYTESAIACLVEIYQDKSQPAAARRAAASDLLDRGHGKPKQSLDLTSDDGSMSPRGLESFYGDQK